MARTEDTGQQDEGLLKSSSQSQTVTRAIDVLNLFTAERPELGIMEMSRLLGISKSSVHRLATTLESAGYLRQDQVNQRYQLGFKVLQLANILLTSLKFRDIALPWMEQLRTQTNETVSLYVADRDARICIERLEGTQDIRFVVDINMRLPLHTGAAGKLLLAYQAEAVRKQLIALWQNESTSLFVHAHGSPEEFERELTSIQKQGYAISIGERVTYAAALAVPILNYRGEILAALTISGPSVRFTEEHILQWLPPAQNAAQAISAQMGYHPAT
jgi:IclR family transcriptional regulator, KDG regulon repressor